MTLVTTAADTKREKCALIVAEQIKQKLFLLQLKFCIMQLCTFL